MQRDCSSIHRGHLLKAPRVLILIFLHLTSFWISKVDANEDDQPFAGSRGLVSNYRFSFQPLPLFWPCNYLGSWTFVLGPCKYLETTGWPRWWRTWRTGASTRWRRSTTRRRRSPRSLYKIPSGGNPSKVKFNKLRYESSTLILYKELSSSFF